MKKELILGNVAAILVAILEYIYVIATASLSHSVLCCRMKNYEISYKNDHLSVFPVKATVLDSNLFTLFRPN